MNTPKPLVSADWLIANIDASDIIILDATWVPPFLKDRPSGPACYAAGHIPGAPFFSIDDIADQDRALKHMLPSAAYFAEKVAALGVSNNTRVVVYDGNGFFASARAWWMFRAMGHDEVSVLDGGLKAWQAAGGEATTQVPTPEAGSFKANLRQDLVRDMISVRDHVKAQDIAILDARAQGRFDGTSPEPRPELPSGHLPGSYCVPASSLIAPDGPLRTADELMPILKDYLDNPVVTSCGSGVSAAVISLALAKVGNWNAAVYDGSWSEWAAQADNPIDTIS